MSQLIVGKFAFQRFFADPDLQGFIASTGASSAPPELMLTEAVSSPDQF